MSFPAKKINVSGVMDVERPLFLGLPMSLCPEFMRKQLAVHARQQRRTIRLADYVADALDQARPRESPYIEKGTVVSGKRQGWMTWEIPGQPKSKMLAFFADNQLQELYYDETRCCEPVERPSGYIVGECGGQRHKSLFRVNGKMEAGSYCEDCEDRDAEVVCWCRGCNGTPSSGACCK